MKILITGCNGQLGKQITNIIRKGTSELGDISKCYKDAILDLVDIENLDITDLEAVKKYVLESKPDIVINSAAYTNVDGCESNKDAAFKVNALGARNLAIATEMIGGKLVQISTDYVFDGEIRDCALNEADITGPISSYGTTKLLGENYVREFSNKYFIVRTAWLYGYFGKNFVYTIMKAAKERGHLTVVNDQKGNPTNAEDLAYHILKLALTEEYGVYHCTGEGECTWYEFACKILEYANIECKVDPVTSDEYKTPAKRPAYSSLDNLMLRCTIKDSMRAWEVALKEFIQNYQKFN